MPHAEWQGEVYKIHGSAPGYPNFADATGYGTGDGSCGRNYNDGVKMTEYEVSQNMRAMERGIRETKRELAGLNAPIEATNDPVLKAKLKDEFNAQSVKLKSREAKYKDFCKKTDHRTDSVRTGVAAVKDKNGKIIGWNQSTAQKAVWSNKRFTEAKQSAIIPKTSETNQIASANSQEPQKRITQIRASYVSEKIAAGEYSTKISKQQYLKHIEGTSQYDRYRADREAKGGNPQSILTISENTAQRIINEYAGSGVVKTTKTGKPTNVECITCSSSIGYYYGGWKFHPANKAAIHYGSESSHIVPINGDFYD